MRRRVQAEAGPAGSWISRRGWIGDPSLERIDAPNPNRVVLRYLDFGDLRYVELQTRSVVNAGLKASTHLFGGATSYILRIG